MNFPRLFALIFAAALLAVVRPARAQWLTQSVPLKAGWNAVFLHVDASHDTLNSLVGTDPGNPIVEVWRWNPPAVAQFTTSPAQPTAAAEWTSWSRTNVLSDLQRLSGDTAYLVHVGTNVSGSPVGTNTYPWILKGHPVAPRHSWSISGLNLIGFPTVTNNAPSFLSFLNQAPELQSSSPEIYYYPGLDTLDTNNPALLNSSPFILNLTRVQRGQAYWIRSGTVFNRYFGPFEVVQSGSGGVQFGDTSSSSTFRLRNLSTSNLTITLRHVASEVPPAGQGAIAAEPPLVVRGSQNLTNLTYGYTNLPLNGTRVWTLAARGQPGSDVEVVLGLNRTAITATNGALLAGILRFTDSLAFTEVNLPVSATVSSSAGLWVGGAAVTQVGEYLKTYPKVSNLITNVVTNLLGAYLTNVTTNTPSSTNLIHLLASLNLPTNRPGEIWTARLTDSNRTWSSVASSSNGTNLVAAVQNGRLYTSTDAGTNWTARESNRNWSAVASSSNGTQLAAAVNGGFLYTSGNSGANWTARLADTNRLWTDVASSSDGTRLIAAAAGGQLYVSTDSGLNWTMRENNRNWSAVASSADGTRLLTGVNTGRLYTSIDSGSNWTAQLTDTNRTWADVASSSDGSRLIAAASGGRLYLSTDGGTNWTARESNRAWSSVASSSDGTRLLAAVNGGGLYLSADSGSNWTAQLTDTNRTWTEAASSADGTRLLAAASGGQLYTSLGTFINYALDPNSGLVLALQGSSAPYLSTKLDTSLAAVKTAFPLRLIVHNPTNGPAVLLQRVFYGFDPYTNVVVARSESSLDQTKLKDARRISSAHLPWTPANTAWPFNGSLGQPASLTTTVINLFDDHVSNPFLHTYHPDHDNLNATFDASQPRGRESFTVERTITLNILPPANDFDSLISAGQTIVGAYEETIAMLGLGSSRREYRVSGGFTLYRVAQVPVLTSAP